MQVLLLQVRPAPQGEPEVQQVWPWPPQGATQMLLWQTSGLMQLGVVVQHAWPCAPQLPLVV